MTLRRVERSGHRGLAWGFRGATFGVALLLGQATAPAVAQVAVPLPDLEGVEPRVRQKVETQREQVLTFASSAESWGRYGMVLDAHRFTRAAVEAYEQAWRLEDSDFRWPYHLASILLFEDPEEAVVWFERALEIDSDYAPAHIRMGEVLEKVGRDDDARRHFQRAFELDPGDPLSSFGLGRLALLRDEVDDALRHLERAYELDSGIQAVVATLARTYHRLGRRDEANELAAAARGLPRMTHHEDPRRGAVRLEAVDSESYLMRARTYADVGQLDRARQELETLVQMEPRNATAHFAAAGVYDRLGLADRALESAQTALELEPDLAGARAVVAGALLKLGRVDEARQQAVRVLETEPRNVHMLMIASLAAAQAGDIEELLSTLGRAFDARTAESPMRPMMMQMLADVAESFAAVGDTAVARQWMEKAVIVAEESGQSSAAAAFDAKLQSY